MKRRAKLVGFRMPYRDARVFTRLLAREKVKEGLGGLVEHPKRLVRATGRDEQMLDRPRVVAEHAAVAHAEPAALEHDDPARLERLGGFLDGLRARWSRPRLARLAASSSIS